MSVNKKFKILLIQLPVPKFSFEKHWGNVPLAAGYLKAMAQKEGLLNEVEIEILGEKDTNLSSDSRLADLIIEKSPHMLGFSLSGWNSIRSLFIAQEVKKKIPNLKVIVGGPEVTLETNYILDNPVLDIGCIGEGEFAFVEIIKHILKGQKDYAGIRGIFYRRSGQTVVTSPTEPIKDLDQIPSPYALGFINPKDYPIVCYQTIRGCPFKCAYCVTGLKPMSYFSVNRICEDLKVILEKGGRAIRFIDSNFLFHPHFYKICEKIKEINTEKKLNFTAFIHTEHLDEEKATLLQECNFDTVETGLQTIKPATLKNIQRPPLRKAEFIAGLRFLEERKINYIVDVIIGLPNDTFQDFKKTLKFLRDSKVRHVSPLVLSVLPGTRLARETKRYGMKYQNKPPYLLIEAPYISNHEIEKAVILARGKSEPPFDITLTNYCNIKYPLLQRKNIGNFSEVKQIDNHINKVILELDSSCQSTDDLEKVGKRLSRGLLQPFTAWFKTRNIEKDLALIKSFLLPIATSNPFLLWSIILESDSNFPLSIVEQIRRNIPSKECLFDYYRIYQAIKILNIVSWKDNKKRKTWLNDIRKVIPFYWAITISKGYSWQREICALSREKYGPGILIDFDPKSKIGFIVEALQFVYKKTKTQPKTILFRNLAIDLPYINFITQTEKSKDILIGKPKHIESILSLDKDMNILSVLRPSNETAMDLIAYQLRFQKILKIL